MHYSWCTVKKADQLTVYTSETARDRTFKLLAVQGFRRRLLQVKAETSMSEPLKVVYHTMTELTGTTD
jgi:hypothetical protein